MATPDKRLWVVWSQQAAGNFDIYARAFDEERNSWLETTRLSSHPFPDINHAVAADSKGRLWVVWQGFHGDNSDVFLRYYDGKTWSKEISSDAGSGQRLGARGGGRSPGQSSHCVGYLPERKLRRLHADVRRRRIGPEMAVTDTPRFEAHASIAIDSSDRVWVAWDETGPDWGKDGGPTDDPHWLEGGEETWKGWLVDNKSPGTNIYASRCAESGDFRWRPA